MTGKSATKCFHTFHHTHTSAISRGREFYFHNPSSTINFPLSCAARHQKTSQADKILLLETFTMSQLQAAELTPVSNNLLAAQRAVH